VRPRRAARVPRRARDAAAARDLRIRLVDGEIEVSIGNTR